MDEGEVKALTEEIFRAELGRYGFRDAAVTVKQEPDGKEYFDIRSHIDPGAERLTAEASLDAIHRLRQELFARGEDRFPNVIHSFQEQHAA